MTYQEKSIWASLIATVLVYGRYFATGGHRLVATIVLLVIIQVTAQIALAVASRPEPKDERDRLIESKAYRTGYVLLVCGILACMNLSGRPSVNAMLMALVGAEIGKSVTQLFLYRRHA